MRKTFYAATALFFILISGNATAQFNKGSKFVETSLGNISFNKNNDKSESSGSTGKSDNSGFGINLTPRIGFFIADNFALGAELDISFNNVKTNYYFSTGAKSSEGTVNRTTLGFGPFARYYFAGSKDGRSKFYGQLGGSINADLSFKDETKYYSPTGAFSGTYKTNYNKKFNILAADAVVGWNRLLAENIALNLNLGYNYSTSTYTYSTTSMPVVGPPTTSPETKYTTNSSAVVWNVGFTMFFPAKGQKNKK